MTQYISKSDIVAEIERLKSIQLSIFSKGETEESCYKALSCISVYNEVLSFLNTLEVKEVDLEKEIQDHIKECLDVKFPTTDIKLIKKDVAYTARKFFELGLKAQKGE